MTALSEYQRLESTGIWRPSPEAQRRDVVVCLGEATLVLTDQSDKALSHWSLAAVERRNPGRMPALFAPGADATEELELADGEMIAAIERVRRAVERSRPAPGRLRTRLALAAGAAIILVAALWMPDAIIRQAAQVSPPAARSEIGARLVGQVERIAGAPCSSQAGDRALGRLEARLLGPDGGRIVILGDGLSTATHVPGGVILLSHKLVEDYETPEVAAGYVLAERMAARGSDPLLQLLDWTGTGTAFRLLMTGDIPDDALRDYAEHLLAAGSVELAPERLLPAFGEARVRATPYAYARDVTGEATITLIEADPVPPEAAMTILSDGDWVALQGICGG
jgi:hypothetical protein